MRFNNNFVFVVFLIKQIIFMFPNLLLELSIPITSVHFTGRKRENDLRTTFFHYEVTFYYYSLSVKVT